MMPGIYSLWIVGRNGGLLYNRVRLVISLRPVSATGFLLDCRAAYATQDFLQLPGLDFNDKLRLASSW